MHNNTTQQYPDIPVHKQTQYPVQQNTEQQYTYMQHIEDNREQHTENTHKPQHRCITYDLHTYSFDFYDEHIYIKKLYNTAIYKLYTFWSPY